MDIAERLAEYASSLRYSDLSPETVEETKRRIVDSLGCAVGAYSEGPVRAARGLAEEWYPGRSATLLGTRRRTTPDMATLVNGLMVRYYDFNDTYLSKEPAHPSDNIPACLAAAEAEGRSGRDLLVAVALAYEIQCRLCDAADLRHRGWDHVCYGLISAALASGRLLGLSKTELANAVNISLNSHLAMRQVRAGRLSMWKGFSFANAARNAVFSALLAREGVTGPSPVFEGEMGFFKQVSGPFELDTAAFGGKEGTRFKVGEAFIKYYPAEYHAQSAIWAALQLRTGVGGDVFERVESVVIESHEAGYTILGKDKEKWSPETRETADHSFPFIVGAALLDGRVDLGTYSARGIRDVRRREFMGRITVREDPSLTRLYPARIANRVTLNLRDGRSLTKLVDEPRGHTTNPMTSEEVERKFTRLTRRFLSKKQAGSVLEIARGIDRQADVSGLIAACAVSDGR
jgi:2-methylcitrate dehydratase